MKASYVAAMCVGVVWGVMCMAVGVVIGRLTATAETLGEDLPKMQPDAPINDRPKSVERRQPEAPPEEPLSPAEKKLIRAIAGAPRREGGRAWPPVKPEEVGSVGFITKGVKVNQVIDELSFLGTMQWRIVAKDADGHPTYQASDDPRYMAWFLGVDTRELFDDKVLAPYPPKKRELIFEDGWETVQPLRYKTAVGASRTVMSLLRFDASRVRKMTDGKSDNELAELLDSLGAN